MAPGIRVLRRRGRPSWGGGFLITPSTIVVTPDTVDLEPAATQQLTAVARNASNEIVVSAFVNYTTSNPAVATVSANGLVTAIGAGTATITGTIRGTLIRDTVAVTVESGDPTALPSFMTAATGAWWDSTEGVSAGSAWVDRHGGLSLPKVGTPLVVPNVLGGRAAVRIDNSSEEQGYSAMVTPLGPNPSAFWLFGLASRDAGQTYPTSFLGSIATLATDNTAVLPYAEIYFRDRPASDPAEHVMAADVWDGVDGFDYSEYDATAPVSNAPADTPYLFELCFDGSGMPLRCFKGGLAVPRGDDATLIAAPFAFDRFTIGVFAPGSGGGLNGKVMLIGGKVGAPSGADQSALYAWVNAVYGLSLPVA